MNKICHNIPTRFTKDFWEIFLCRDFWCTFFKTCQFLVTTLIKKISKILMAIQRFVAKSQVEINFKTLLLFLSRKAITATIPSARSRATHLYLLILH